MNKFLIIFVDGVGIGKKDYKFNPFFKYKSRLFNQYFSTPPSLENQVIKEKDSFVFPIDPTMGVAGLPQSGTGQTSIFCGVNAPELIGKHFGPYPYSTLVPIIKEENIFTELKNLGHNVYFANAYPDQFFTYLEKGKRRLNTTALMCLLSNTRLNTLYEILNRTALTPYITNERLNIKLKLSLPSLSVNKAADILINQTKKHTLTVYEYYFTDYFGHNRYSDEMEYNLLLLDKFIISILEKIDQDKDLTLLICSDHGNIEDLSVKTHTYNPALTITKGKFAENFFNEIKNLSDIKHVILKYAKL